MTPQQEFRDLQTAAIALGIPINYAIARHARQMAAQAIEENDRSRAWLSAPDLNVRLGNYAGLIYFCDDQGVATPIEFLRAIRANYQPNPPKRLLDVCKAPWPDGTVQVLALVGAGRPPALAIYLPAALTAIPRDVMVRWHQKRPRLNPDDVDRKALAEFWQILPPGMRRDIPRIGAGGR